MYCVLVLSEHRSAWNEEVVMVVSKIVGDHMILLIAWRFQALDKFTFNL